MLRRLLGLWAGTAEKSPATTPESGENADDGTGPDIGWKLAIKAAFTRDEAVETATENTDDGDTPTKREPPPPKPVLCCEWFFWPQLPGTLKDTPKCRVQGVWWIATVADTYNIHARIKPYLENVLANTRQVADLYEDYGRPHGVLKVMIKIDDCAFTHSITEEPTEELFEIMRKFHG